MISFTVNTFFNIGKIFSCMNCFNSDEQLTDLMADFEASSNHVEISRIKRNIPAALTFREKREALAFELNNEPRYISIRRKSYL